MARVHHIGFEGLVRRLEAKGYTAIRSACSRLPMQLARPRQQPSDETLTCGGCREPSRVDTALAPDFREVAQRLVYGANDTGPSTAVPAGEGVVMSDPANFLARWSRRHRR